MILPEHCENETVNMIVVLNRASLILMDGGDISTARLQLASSQGRQLTRWRVTVLNTSIHNVLQKALINGDCPVFRYDIVPPILARQSIRLSRSMQR